MMGSTKTIAKTILSKLGRLALKKRGITSNMPLGLAAVIAIVSRKCFTRLEKGTMSWNGLETEGSMSRALSGHVNKVSKYSLS